MGGKERTGQNKVKRSQKFDRRILTFTYRLLKLVDEGLYCSKIAKLLKTKKQVVHYHLKKLERKGYIKAKIRDAIKIYEITDVGREYLKYLEEKLGLNRGQKIGGQNVSEGVGRVGENFDFDLRAQVHAVVLTFRVLEDKTKDSFWDIIYSDFSPKRKIKKCYDKGFTLDLMGDTLKAYLHRRDFSYIDLNQRNIESWLSDMKEAIFLYALQNGLKLDYNSAKYSYGHYAIQDPFLYLSYYLNLIPQKPKLKILDIWEDNTPFLGTVESDKFNIINTYKTLLLLMPFKVANMERNMLIFSDAAKSFGKNINLHLKVMKMSLLILVLSSLLMILNLITFILK